MAESKKDKTITAKNSDMKDDHAAPSTYNPSPQAPEQPNDEKPLAPLVPQPIQKSEMVCVALNHPHGIAFGMPDGSRIEIKGNAVHLRGQGKGALPVGGFGLTMVKREDWEYIQKTYNGMAIFKNGLICVQDSKDKAEDQAKEQKETRHGREPVDVADPNKTQTRPADAAV